MIAGLYDSGFYDGQSAGSLASARVVLGELFQHATIDSVLDVGCGAGTWLQAAQELGASDIVGLDGHYVPHDALLIPQACFHPTDISVAFDLQRRFDLVICLEAAEHLSPTAAATLVASLSRHGDLVLFSAALPFQGGTGHVNENWLEYWSALFAAQAFRAVDGLRWRVWTDQRVEWWYRQNLMLFAREGTAQLPSWAPPALPASAVHPELFLRALRRRPTVPLRTSLADDLEHWRKAGAASPQAAVGYGEEFSTHVEEMPPISSYQQLRDLPRWKLPAVLSDALAAYRLADTAAPRLSRSALAPDFVGIGVQKAASTWLYDLLNRHPKAFLPPGKEMNFFNRRAFAPWSAYCGLGLVERMVEHMRTYFAVTPTIWPPWVKLLAHIANPAEDQRWYEGVFDLPLPDKRLRGDITPEYSLLPTAAFEDMKTLNPNIKIVLLLRDPVDRAISQLGMIVDQAPIAHRFAADLIWEDSILRRGSYQDIVTNLREVFSPEQIFIGFVDDLQTDPWTLLTRLAAFLELEPDLFPQDVVGARVYERGSRLTLGPDIEQALRKHYEETYRFLADEFPSPCGAWHHSRPT